MMTPVILAGGAGTRLWPLSRHQRPKQFLSLLDDAPLLAATLARLEGLDHAPPIVICHEDHRFLAAEQLRRAGVADATLLLEPEGRGTAPAIALAALLVQRRDERHPLVVLPADHCILDRAAFQASLARALALAEQGWLTTLGVVPDRAETGYGYVRPGAPLSEGGRRVAAFVEKPDAATAEALLAEGECCWNSGLFVLRPDVYLDELARLEPAILDACRRAMTAASLDRDFLRPGAEAFLSSPDRSIDVAVMECTARAATVPLAAGWSDIGSWQALWEALPHDADGNALRGEVRCAASRNLLVHAEGQLVATLGVENLAIVTTADAVLVADRRRGQELRQLVDRLTVEGRAEVAQHATVHRPWGRYRILEAGPGYQVKHLTVKPGARLSRQYHRHRAEHWVVVGGTARVTLDDEALSLAATQSIDIPVGRVHCLANPGPGDLELIEVQSGDYLGEDDIVRLDDRYGRE
ncbi:mannose-1-phosphate guanylyltransferase/mannose-6-phosphate isomerase [Billgrantia gudaonensis]|uniref:mannose-1-phosphate guanylyltransferase n=1 Tax=Billgrantia gudaonensis TaxID=376427 RepID=A0A1G8ZIG0_9GAMM|nr:mannose-1-phosphate guanylyltransferase/mannose-6-phosphate isomerase [Halomonas gudaonensis]SDK14783.1 mannose-1-phosphate guanylyltransferase [Halomonas gudaonensis]